MDTNTKDKPICSSHSIEVEELTRMKIKLEKEKDLDLLSSIFKALGDHTRLRIIYLLTKSPLCVCDIATLLDMTQSSISHHLRVLRDLNLVKFVRKGKLVIYSLDDNHVLELFEQGLDHVSHH